MTDYSTSKCPYHRAVYAFSKRWVQLLLSLSAITGFVALAGFSSSIAFHSIVGIAALAVITVRAYEESTWGYLTVVLLLGVTTITGLAILSTTVEVVLVSHVLVALLSVLIAFLVLR